MIRLAESEDALDIARVHVASWQIAYRGQMPESYLNGLKATEWALRWARNFRDDSPSRLIFVACEPATQTPANETAPVVGFCSFSSSRDADAPPNVGEITAPYVDPSFWRSGHGTALIDAVVAAARERQYYELTLWVLAGNLAARAFYEARGFFPDGAAKVERRPELSLNEVRYRLSLR